MLEGVVIRNIKIFVLQTRENKGLVLGTGKQKILSLKSGISEERVENVSYQQFPVFPQCFPSLKVV